ncbi:hypothetical protein DENSPDRAFT_191449 [Dentipellis sp. KUC8613]|nr:hypothetical protein DENSPDRAFT_191449 [Dentipellis sp. KUC8613]
MVLNARDETAAAKSSPSSHEDLSVSIIQHYRTISSWSAVPSTTPPTRLLSPSAPWLLPAFCNLASTAGVPLATAMHADIARGKPKHTSVDNAPGYPKHPRRPDAIKTTTRPFRTRYRAIVASHSFSDVPSSASRRLMPFCFFASSLSSVSNALRSFLAFASTFAFTRSWRLLISWRKFVVLCPAVSCSRAERSSRWTLASCSRSH